MQLSELRDRLADRLDHAAYADVDASANGLQVGDRDAEIERVAVAVDGAEATIEAAAAEGADVLLVHHGIVWGGLETVTGPEYDRVAACVEHDVALYASHLPLDGHPELGNAAGLAEFLDCSVEAPFGDYGGQTIGQYAHARDPYTVDDLADRLAELEGGGSVDVLEFGPGTVSEIAILTGSGTDWIREAAAAGADALVTGELKQQAYHEARAAGLNVFGAGHYATETFGVRRLADLISGWGPETTYLEHPTGI